MESLFGWAPDAFIRLPMESQNLLSVCEIHPIVWVCEIAIESIGR